MAPTTCSVFLLSHLVERAVGTQPWTVCSYSAKYNACSSHSGSHPAMSQGQPELHIYTLLAHSCDHAEINIHLTVCVREQLQIRLNVPREQRSCTAHHWEDLIALKLLALIHIFIDFACQVVFLLSRCNLPPRKEFRVCTVTQKSFEVRPD